MEQEEPMNLPNDIRLKIEKSPDKEDILLLLARLENDGVAITNDVYAAIVTTLEYTKLGGSWNRSSAHIPAGTARRAEGDARGKLFQSWLNGLHKPAPRSANGKRGWDNFTKVNYSPVRSLACLTELGGSHDVTDHSRQAEAGNLELL